MTTDATKLIKALDDGLIYFDEKGNLHFQDGDPVTGADGNVLTLAMLEDEVGSNFISDVGKYTHGTVPTPSPISGPRTTTHKIGDIVDDVFAKTYLPYLYSRIGRPNANKYHFRNNQLYRADPEKYRYYPVRLTTDLIDDNITNGDTDMLNALFSDSGEFLGTEEGLKDVLDKVRAGSDIIAHLSPNERAELENSIDASDSKVTNLGNIASVLSDLNVGKTNNPASNAIDNTVITMSREGFPKSQEFQVSIPRSQYNPDNDEDVNEVDIVSQMLDAVAGSKYHQAKEASSMLADLKAKMNAEDVLKKIIKAKPDSSGNNAIASLLGDLFGDSMDGADDESIVALAKSKLRDKAKADRKYHKDEGITRKLTRRQLNEYINKYNNLIGRNFGIDDAGNLGFNLAFSNLPVFYDTFLKPRGIEPTYRYNSKRLGGKLDSDRKARFESIKDPRDARFLAEELFNPLFPGVPEGAATRNLGSWFYMPDEELRAHGVDPESGKNLYESIAKSMGYDVEDPVQWADFVQNMRTGAFGLNLRESKGKGLKFNDPEERARKEAEKGRGIDKSASSFLSSMAEAFNIGVGDMRLIAKQYMDENPGTDTAKMINDFTEHKDEIMQYLDRAREAGEAREGYKTKFWGRGNHTPWATGRLNDIEQANLTHAQADEYLGRQMRIGEIDKLLSDATPEEAEALRAEKSDLAAENSRVRNLNMRMSEDWSNPDGAKAAQEFLSDITDRKGKQSYLNNIFTGITKGRRSSSGDFSILPQDVRDYVAANKDAFLDTLPAYVADKHSQYINVPIVKEANGPDGKPVMEYDDQPTIRGFMQQYIYPVIKDIGYTGELPIDEDATKAYRSRVIERNKKIREEEGTQTRSQQKKEQIKKDSGKAGTTANIIIKTASGGTPTEKQELSHKPVLHKKEDTAPKEEQINEAPTTEASVTETPTTETPAPKKKFVVRRRPKPDTALSVSTEAEQTDSEKPENWSETDHK